VIDNTRGILAMSASVVVFIFNDALIKLAAESVPSVQAIGVRGVFATLWCALALLASGAWRQIAMAANPHVLLRGALEAAAAIVYLVALFHIPFAIATAVNLSTPLVLTVLAVLMLRERNIPNDLNVQSSQRISVVLTYLALMLAPFYWPGSAISLIITIGLNHRFYRFLARKRGLWFAVRAVPMHLAYFLYSGASFVVGCVKAIQAEHG